MNVLSMLKKVCILPFAAVLVFKHFATCAFCFIASSRYRNGFHHQVKTLARETLTSCLLLLFASSASGFAAYAFLGTSGPDSLTVNLAAFVSLVALTGSFVYGFIFIGTLEIKKADMDAMYAKEGMKDPH